MRKVLTTCYIVCLRTSVVPDIDKQINFNSISDSHFNRTPPSTTMAKCVKAKKARIVLGMCGGYLMEKKQFLIIYVSS